MLDKKKTDIIVWYLINRIPYRFRAKEEAETEAGILYKFKWQGKTYTPVVPESYPYYEDRETGLRLVGLQHGTTTPSALFGEKYNDPADAVAVIHLTGAKVKNVKAIHGAGAFPIKWIIIGLLVIVLVVVGLKMLPTDKNKNSNVNATTEQVK